MRLTKKKAIELSIELWTWLAETGKAKGDWPEWDKYGEVDTDCFLCEYGWRRVYKVASSKFDPCDFCPYHARFGECAEPPTPYTSWDDSLAKEDRIKYAKLFLEQLKQLGDSYE